MVYSLCFGLFICLFAFIITREFSRSSQEDFDSALLNYAIDLSGQVDIETADFQAKLKLSEREGKKRFPFIEESTNYSIRSLEGEILNEGKHDHLQQKIPYNKELGKEARYTHRFHSIKEGKMKFRAVNLKIANNKGREIILQVSTPSNILDEQGKRIRLLNFSLIPIMILLSGIVSFIIASRALVPIKVITATVNSIAAKNLSLRLPEFETNDEFQELSLTFNHLLERLQKSFEAQEHFVANASHQLNTPLTIIKGELDVLESKGRSIEDHQKFNRSLREEIERMIELVKNLLLIARIEAGQEDSFRMGPVRIDEVITSTISRMQPKARDKNINIRFNMHEDLQIDDLIIDGERQLLGSMFENLLDNAIKYSPVGSRVSFDIARGEGIFVSVKDEGQGIKPSELKNILEKRFRRGAMTLMPGTGIGLSIVYKIAEHHKATISCEKLQPQGSLFKVQFAKQNS